jgi:hypothetical protein
MDKFSRSERKRKKDNTKKIRKYNKMVGISSSYELDEGGMKELHMLISQGKSAEQIAKIMKLDVKTIKALMKGYKESDDSYRPGGASNKLDEADDTFAGCKVFKVSSEDYGNCVQTPRKKNERWNKKLNMEMNGGIRQYAHRNPGKPVIVQDENSGAMSYLIFKSQGD